MRGKFKFNPYTCGVLASTFVFAAVFAWTGASGAGTSGQTHVEREQRFSGTIKPFMQTYCLSCHGKTNPQAQLDLTTFANLGSVARDYPRWSLVVDKLAAKQMPPPNAGKQPSEAQRNAVLACIRSARQAEATRNAGDPGPVLARRLSNAEYDYTIRDLTGVDLRPTREFPVDPANQEGFDNSGESLTLSPALMKKYVQAAKDVGESHGADLDRPGFCGPPRSGRDRPGQIWDIPHRELLQAAADGHRRLFSGRVALSPSRRARRSHRHFALCCRQCKAKPALSGTGLDDTERAR